MPPAGLGSSMPGQPAVEGSDGALTPDTVVSKNTNRLETRINQGVSDVASTLGRAGEAIILILCVALYAPIEPAIAVSSIPFGTTPATVPAGSLASRNPGGQ